MVRTMTKFASVKYTLRQGAMVSSVRSLRKAVPMKYVLNMLSTSEPHMTKRTYNS